MKTSQDLREIAIALTAKYISEDYMSFCVFSSNWVEILATLTSCVYGAGDVRGAGTSANVYIILFGGRRGEQNTGKINLQGKFERLVFDFHVSRQKWKYME